VAAGDLIRNKPFSAWGEIFGDDVVAAAMIDRLVHHAEILALKGDSYRLTDLACRRGCRIVWIGDEGEVVVAARPTWREQDRCDICRRRSPGFDLGDGRRRWRALDLGTTLAFVEADAPGVTAAVRGSWSARSRGRATRRASPRLRRPGRVVGRQHIEGRGRRVDADRLAQRRRDLRARRLRGPTQIDLLAGLRRIGIDEISHRTGQRYLTVVVDHDTGRLVWAPPAATAGPSRRSSTRWTRSVARSGTKPAALARSRLPRTSRALASRCGRTPRTSPPAAAQARRDQKTNHKLDRGYLLQEQLRQIYRLPADAAIRLLDGWLKWARRCRLAPFVKLARTITDQHAGIVAAIQHGLSNARVEAINTQIRLLARRGFGFHSVDALIACRSQARRSRRW
jgi:transposase